MPVATPVTAEEIYKGLLAELRYFETTSVSPKEFNYHIWRGMLQWIRNRYWSTGNHQAEKDDLDVLKIVTDGWAGSPSPLTNLGGNQPYIDLPDDYLHLLSVGVRVRFKNVPCQIDGQLSEYVPSTPLKEDERFAVGQDYYKLPQAIWPDIYHNHRDRKLTFFVGDSTVEDVIISYYRYPQRIEFNPGGVNVDSEFAWEQAMQIIRFTAVDLLEKTQNPRWQSMSAEEQKHFLQSPPPNVMV